MKESLYLYKTPPIRQSQGHNKYTLRTRRLRRRVTPLNTRNLRSLTTHYLQLLKRENNQSKVFSISVITDQYFLKFQRLMVNNNTRTHRRRNTNLLHIDTFCGRRLKLNQIGQQGF